MPDTVDCKICWDDGFIKVPCECRETLPAEYAKDAAAVVEEAITRRQAEIARAQGEDYLDDDDRLTREDERHARLSGPAAVNGDDL